MHNYRKSSSGKKSFDKKQRKKREAMSPLCTARVCMVVLSDGIHVFLFRHPDYRHHTSI